MQLNVLLFIKDILNIAIFIINISEIWQYVINQLNDEFKKATLKGSQLNIVIEKLLI